MIGELLLTLTYVLLAVGIIRFFATNGATRWVRAMAHNLNYCCGKLFKVVVGIVLVSIVIFLFMMSLHETERALTEQRRAVAK